MYRRSMCNNDAINSPSLCTASLLNIEGHFPTMEMARFTNLNTGSANKSIIEPVAGEKSITCRM